MKMDHRTVLTRRNFLGRSLSGLTAVVIGSYLLGCNGNSSPPGVIKVEDPNSQYSVVKKSTLETIEYKFMFDKKHFMTLIDKNGMFIFRPHPGDDANGWGSSWYAQPFLPNAIIRDTKINSITVKTNEVMVDAVGNVSGEFSPYGSWKFNMGFNYNLLSKRISGNGVYSINLDDLLDSSTGDLNLYKIASNYLDDVPLLGGGMGDTGDMERANVIGKNNFSWIPDINGNHFPMDFSDSLSIDVIGRYNNVDTAAQGFSPILPAYKPSMKVVLISQIPDIPMMFGAIYDTSIDPNTGIERSKLFFEDNVGITPLVNNSSLDKEYNFDALFESVPLPGG